MPLSKNTRIINPNGPRTSRLSKLKIILLKKTAAHAFLGGSDSLGPIRPTSAIRCSAASLTYWQARRGKNPPGEPGRVPRRRARPGSIALPFGGPLGPRSPDANPSQREKPSADYYRPGATMRAEIPVMARSRAQTDVGSPRPFRKNAEIARPDCGAQRPCGFAEIHYRLRKWRVLIFQREIAPALSGGEFIGVMG